jgi:hypothetical protein
VLVTPTTEGTAAYRRRYEAGLRDAGGARALGEKTSYYLENEDVPDRIAAAAPRARLLFIVREPVQRAYSNYLWSRKNGIETLGFRDAVRLEGTRPNPLGPDREYARPFDYMTRGRYGTFAERYYSRFGRDAVRFVLYEDLERNPIGIMHEIQQFIGVDPIEIDAQSLGRINAARHDGDPLAAADARALRASIAPEVRRFADLTGLDIGPWGY